jgi:hypothetical protein
MGNVPAASGVDRRVYRVGRCRILYRLNVGEPRVDAAFGAVSSSPRAKTASFAGAFALGFEVPPLTPSFGVRG